MITQEIINLQQELLTLQNSGNVDVATLSRIAFISNRLNTLNTQQNLALTSQLANSGLALSQKQNVQTGYLGDISGRMSSSNSTTTPLNSGVFFTGDWVDTTSLGSIYVSVDTDKQGTLYIDYSLDASTTSYSLNYTYYAGETFSPVWLVNPRQYVRVRFLNTSVSNQTYLRITTKFGNLPFPATTLDQNITKNAPSIFVRPYDFALDVGEGSVNGVTSFTKQGNNNAVTTSLVVISQSGFYRTPTTATSLEFVSSSVNDTSAGTGARQVTIIGLDSTGAEISQTISTNGTTAVAIPTALFRLYKWYVQSSGSYADTNTPTSSHAGTLTIRVAGGGATWSTIGLIGTYGKGYAQIGGYTVPKGKKLYLFNLDITVETNKLVNAYLFERPSALVTTAPYTVARIRREYDGLSGAVTIGFEYPLVFTELTDIQLLGQTTTGTANVSTQWDGVLVDFPTALA